MQYAVEIANLCFSYPDGRPALKGICLEIPVGQTVGLIGPNGAGKSTLLLHLNGVLGSNGAVKVMSRTVEEKNLRWVRSKVGLVFQEADDQLFSPTVFDDVAFGPINMGLTEAEVRQRVAQALEWVGMGGYEQRLSHRLSVGEKKSISIATVLSMNPEILVLDEPTSNLDPRAKWGLVELLQRLPMTKIIASHDLDMIEVLCPRTIILDGGQVVADGATAQLLSDFDLLQAHGLAEVSRRR